MSPLKYKITVFKGEAPVRSKILTDNITIEKINYVNILGMQSFIRDANVRNSEQCFKAKFSPNIIFIEVKYYFSYPITFMGCEIWAMKQKDIRRLKTSNIKFTDRIAGYNLLDRRRNENILEEIKRTLIRPCREEISII
jgi:hypothetical protein